MPLAPQPGVDVHAGKAVTGGGEFALKRLTPHLSVIDHRKAELLLHSDDLPHRAVLGRLEPSRRELTPRVGFAGIAQELRPQQASHMLNPRIHRHHPSVSHHASFLTRSGIESPAVTGFRSALSAPCKARVLIRQLVRTGSTELAVIWRTCITRRNARL